MKQTLLFRNAWKIVFALVFPFVLLVICPLSSNAQTVTSNTQSTHNGFFYSFWNDGSQGSASMTLGAAGNYTTTWNNVGNFTAGKGWAVGKADRVVCFSGSFNGGSNGFLALYGWTKNNLIEYYVCENHGSWTPPGNTSDIQQKGTYTSDGGTYTIYTATRTNQPSIIGTATFKQYWSVRTQTRSSGTITFANHVAAWQAAGMSMGTTWDYQIMESEGYHSTGSSNITVSECPVNTCTTPKPTTTATINYDLGATATQLTATGTSLKWYTVATGGTAATTAPTPSTSAVGITKYYVSQTSGCEGERAEITVNVSQKYKVYKVSSPIAIDGTIEASWTNASVLPAAAAKLLSGTVTNSADLSGNFKAVWDDTYLYVLADITDDTKTNESANVYDDDAVEVYIDINNDKATAYGTNDAQYSFGWNDGTTVGVLPTGRSTTGITYAATARTGGYIIEARIPWTTMQGSPVIGQLVGMDFMINDDDDGGTRDGKLSWNAATDNAWQDPSIFGTAILQGLLPCTTPAAPTVTAAVSFCQNATATALTATGTSLLWYTAATGGTGSATAIIPATTAAGTVNYYVSQNVGGCESARALIAVTVNAAPNAPAVTAAVAYCQNATATALSATGAGLKWYTVATGGTALANTPTPSTSATGTTNYYVSQTTTGCESARALIAVTVNAAPSAPTVTAAVAYCQNATATALSATGAGLKWYTVATGGTALANIPTPSTTAIGTTNYYVSQTTTGCESARATIAVTVNAAPSAPTVTAAVAYCQNATATALTATGTTLKWYTVATNGTALANTPTPSTSATGTTNYYVSQTTTGCESARAAIAVTVNATPNAPTVTAAVAYCQNATATALSANGTGLKWYTVATNGTALANTPTPSTSATGTTNYYVSQTTTGCESARATIAVTVNAAPNAPTVTAAVSYCQNATATALSANGTGLKWYTVATNGTALANTPTPSTSATGATNYYVSQTTTGCESARAAIAVTVNAAPTATISVSGNTTIVPGETTSLQANTGTGLTYKWFNGNNEVGTNATYTANTAGSYTVDVSNASGCTTKSASTVISAGQNQPSVITITSLIDNASVQAPVTISANVTDADGAIVLVEFLDGLTVIGSSSDAPYSMVWTNPSTGSHSITVRAKDVFGDITTSSPITISTGVTTAVQASRNNVNGNVYPIPAKDYVTVETELDLAHANFRVTNALGEEVSLPINIDGLNAKLDLSALSDGVYLLVITENDRILTKKIILAH